MSLPTFIYVGSSWANKSFEPIGSCEPETNLAKEWNFPVVDLSKQAVGCLDRLRAITASGLSLPIVWLNPEPLLDIQEITGMTMVDFLKRPDWREIQQECDYYCCRLLNQLGVQVLLIGAHADVQDHGFANLHIGHDSWQKWLAKKAGLVEQNNRIFVNTDGIGNNWVHYCWGADLVHLTLWQHPDVDPEPSLVDNIIDHFLFWKELERRGLFFDVHPNRHGNILFAEAIRPKVQDFLQDQA